jgi:DNA mismatch repair protein MutS
MGLLQFLRRYSEELAPTKRTLSSIMQQHELFAKEHPGKLIALQVGDFFEFMGSDAQIASSVLDLALGTRLGAPFTGFPVRSVDVHLPKLLKAGHQVVLCEQYRDRLRGIFRRRVSKILTPGTVVEGELLASKHNNFLVAVSLVDSEHARLAWADVGTGEFYRHNRIPLSCLLAETKRIAPSEILFSDAEVVEPLEKSDYKLTRRPGEGKPADELIVAYIQETCPQPDDACMHVLLREPQEMAPQSYMAIEEIDARALDLACSNSSLLRCLDECLTASGSRLLQHRLQYPSLDLAEITSRLDLVRSFLDDQRSFELTRSAFKGITDIERCWQRLRLGRSTPRDLRNLLQGLLAIHVVRPFPQPEHCELVRSLEGSLEECLPSRVVDGPVLRPGYDARLDELRSSGGLRHDELQELIGAYREETGLGGQLRACIMRGGYFFEFPRRLAPLADTGRFFQDGSTAVKWRYRTKDLDALFIRAERSLEEAKEREVELYNELVHRLLAELREEGPRAIDWMARMDVASASACLARQRDYCRPQLLVDGATLQVKAGRHPVVEWIHNQQAKSFTSNDLFLGSGQCFAFLSGPNMGGKSTFLRQNALIVIMAQAGLFVPAESAVISLVDTVLTRIGASDNLAADQSTFMVEMGEAARLLQRSTARSLVIVDELGRGTAPSEGTAIAAAVARELQRRHCRCLFATHLLDVKEHLSLDVIFLRSVGDCRSDALVLDHRILPGISEQACALGVARIAGLPPTVLQEAQDILHQCR